MIEVLSFKVDMLLNSDAIEIMESSNFNSAEAMIDVVDRFDFERIEFDQLVSYIEQATEDIQDEKSYKFLNREQLEIEEEERKLKE